MLNLHFKVKTAFLFIFNATNIFLADVYICALILKLENMFIYIYIYSFDMLSRS